jgi:pterin-4a-carbinolamine dehydratase
MERRKLSHDEIEQAIKGLNGWRAEDDMLVKRFEFPNFAESLAFVNKVG